MDGIFLELYPVKGKGALLRNPPGMSYYPVTPKRGPESRARLRLLHMLRIMRGLKVTDTNSVVVNDDPQTLYYVGVSTSATTSQTSEQFWSIDPEVDNVGADFWRGHEIHVMLSVRSWSRDPIPPRLMESLWRLASTAAALRSRLKPKIRLTLVPDRPLLAGVRLLRAQAPEPALARQMTAEANYGARLLYRSFREIISRIDGGNGDRPVSGCSILDPTHRPVMSWEGQQGSLKWLSALLLESEQWDSPVATSIANGSVGVSEVFGSGPQFVIGDSGITGPLIESARKKTGRSGLVGVAPLPMVWFHGPSASYSADKAQDPYDGLYNPRQWDTMFRGSYAPWAKPLTRG